MTIEGPQMPGPEGVVRRPLHFIWLVDRSSSMAEEGKIQQLNAAIREALPSMRDVAKKNPHLDLYVRALSFGSDARWEVSQPTLVDDFQWTDVVAEGRTAMGAALALVAEQLQVPPMEPRAYPPLLAVVTDGYPTDDFEAGLSTLTAVPWGERAVRVGIAIGDADTDMLRKFIANVPASVESRGLFQARNADELADAIKVVSTAIMSQASQARVADVPTSAVVPLPTGGENPTDVF